MNRFPLPGQPVSVAGSGRSADLMSIVVSPPAGPPDQSGPLVLTARVMYQDDGETAELPIEGVSAVYPELAKLAIWVDG